jgi:hypothetical protein
LFVLLSSRERTAYANGRFPASNQIVVTPHDPELVLVRVTFGLLVSHDRGKSFDWVCEPAIGYTGVEDPMYTVTPSRHFVGSTFDGIAISRDQGCNWSKAKSDNQEEDIAGKVFTDLAANPRDGKHIVVFSSSYDRQSDAGEAFFANEVWETKDEGNTFRPLQPRGFNPLLLGSTIDLTATDPDRIYITARDSGTPPKAFLLTSKNHGRTWDEMPIPLEGVERSVFIAAVDPTNAERVYLRTSTAGDEPTRLLMRELASDAGAGSAARPRLRVLHRAAGALLGFALSSDGKKIYIGGPKDGLKVAEMSGGDDGGFVFHQRSTVQVQCLALSPDGLWACSNEQTGFIAGLSKDDGATFESRVRFCDIRGPLACAPSSGTTKKCNAAWPPQKSTLGCDRSNKVTDNDSGALIDKNVVAPSPSSSSSPSPSSSSSSWSSSQGWLWILLIGGVGGSFALLRLMRRRK